MSGKDLYYETGMLLPQGYFREQGHCESRAQDSEVVGMCLGLSHGETGLVWPGPRQR